MEVAAKYLADFYDHYDYRPGASDNRYFQSFQLIKTRVVSNILRIENQRLFRPATVEEFQYGGDFIRLIKRITPNFKLHSTIVFAGYGITAPEYGYDDYAEIDVRGKIALAFEGEPGSSSDESYFKGETVKTHYSSASIKGRMAADHGALALLLMQHPSDTRDIKSRMTKLSKRMTDTFMVLPESKLDEVPTYFISSTIAENLRYRYGKSLATLARLLDKDGRPSRIRPKAEVHLGIDSDTATISVQNVVALLEGSDPQLKHEYIVLSAHFDHKGVGANGEVYYGADDNASGTAALLEIARALLINPQRPRRSILFLHVSAEEVGLLGSRYFSENPTVLRSDIVANLNIDMVGRNDPDSIYVIGTNMLSWDLHHINVAASALVPGLDLSYRYNDRDDKERFYYRSDHYNFAKYKIPVTFYFAGVHEDYHKPSDTPEKLNYTKLRNVARLVYLTAWELANRDEKLNLDGVLLKQQLSRAK